MEKLSTDQKLDFLISEVAKIQKQTAEIPVLVAKISALETTVKNQDTIIASLQKDVLQLKTICNDREQLARGNTLRLFNFPGSGSEVGLAARVYDKILKPILPLQPRTVVRSPPSHRWATLSRSASVPANSPTEPTSPLRPSS